MLTLFFYFGIWLFVAWFFEPALAKILWTAFWFTPFVRQLFFGNKNPAEAPRQEAKPPIADNPPEATTESVNPTRQAHKRFSKAVPESAVKVPVPNRARRIVPVSFQKGIPETALVMVPRRIRSWKAVPAGERSRVCREYFAYRLRLPWILAASPGLLGRFLFGNLAWSLYHDDGVCKSTGFAQAGEEGNVFHEFMANEYKFAHLCHKFDLVCETLGDRNLASSYIRDKNMGLRSIERCTPEALIIDVGTWANPDLKRSPLSDWCAGAAAAGLAAGFGFALFSGNVDGTKLQKELNSLTSWDAKPEPFVKELARQADELYQEKYHGAEREKGHSIVDKEDFSGVGFSDGEGVGEYADSDYGGRYYVGGDFDYGTADAADGYWDSGGSDWGGSDGGWSSGDARGGYGGFS